MSKQMHSRLLRAVLPVAVVLLPGCDLDVSNPGRIPDEDLNTPGAMPGLVNGMSADLSEAVGSLARAVSVMAGELTHSGNYANEGFFYRGIIEPENVNGLWNDMQRARWVAEHGIERMKTVLGDDFETSTLSTRAYLYAGFSNRLLGENVCAAVIDGGPQQDVTVHFERAEQQFGEALRLARAQGESELEHAALAGRASVRLSLGDWDGAVADAELVPDDFHFDAIFSTNTSREENTLADETISRREFSVYGVEWAEHYGDPRTPWDSVFVEEGGPLQTGQDGETPFFRQTKYTTLGAEIPLVKGAEMLLLRAEAALRDADVPGAVALINQQRDVYGLPHIAAATAAEAWPILERERGAVLWLEARRLADLRRWYAESGPAHHAFLEGRDPCIPISLNEQNSNPNL